MQNPQKHANPIWMEMCKEEKHYRKKGTRVYDAFTSVHGEYLKYSQKGQAFHSS